VFENLGNPKHRKHYTRIVKTQNAYASPPVKRMIESYAKKHNIDDFENMDLINQMTVEGLNFDFFGDKDGKPSESISEKDFDISVSEGNKNYRILGFIDKLFLFKRKKQAVIRDFKTSKQIFSGKDYTDNMQDLMYCLAVKHLYPEFLKRKMEFLFLKFDCNNEGNCTMKPLDDDELEGFEYFLTEVQQIINNFNEVLASKNLAYNKGYLGRDDGFAGRVVCGRADYAGQLKKDGTPMWHCPFKFPREFYALVDTSGVRIASADLKEDLESKFNSKLSSEGGDLKIEKVKYDGCPAFSFDKRVELL
tara:strand:+ start:17062 stop:17979 length:918 start_codon:yes stop_codon:yes gene_type:complete